MRGDRPFLGYLAGSLLVSLSWTDAASAQDPDKKLACIADAEAGQESRDVGKYALARAQFQRCLDPACPSVVRENCGRWYQQVVDSTPTIVPSATRPGQEDVNARVFADGVLVAGRLDGRPVPLDPGPHDLRFEGDRGEIVTVHLLLRAGDSNRVVNAEFPSHRPPASATEAPPSRPASSRARVIASLSVLGAGLAGVGLGMGFGLASQGDANQAATLRASLASSGCGASTALPTCGALASAVGDQRRDGTISVVGYAAGGALIGAAAIAWIAWPHAPSAKTGLTVLPGAEGTALGLTASLAWP
jgi:hypothetical protein